MTGFEPNNSLPSYSQEDVQKILQLAIARQVDDQDKEFSYQQLLEIATELEISPETLNLAEKDWRSQNNELIQRQVFNNYRITKLKKRLGNYAIVNGFLSIVNLIAAGTLTWSLYILIFSALVIGLDIWNTSQTKGEDYEIAFQKWNRKHQIKQTVSSLINKWFKAIEI